jgi:hypothetical protein
MASNNNRKRQPDILKQTMDRFNDSWEYQKQNWHPQWDRDQKLYDNERYRENYHSVSDTAVPMAFQTVETMNAALNNSSLRFDFESSDPLRRTSAAPLNSLIDEWWEDDQWDLALEEDTREMLKIGMAGNMFTWDVDHPHLDHYAMRDMIVDPTVRNPADLQQPGFYAGRRYFVKKDSWRDIEVIDADPDSKTYGQLVPRYSGKGTDTTSAADQGDDATDKALKEAFNSSTLSNAATKQDELIEIWDVDRVVTVLNRKEVIEDIENPHKTRHRYMLKKQYVAELGEEAEPEDIADAEARADRDAEGLNPFFFFRNYRETSLFYAKSEVSFIWKLIESLNDQTNADLDIGIRQNAPQRELDPLYQDWIDLLTNDPDVVYPFTPGSLKNIDPPIGSPQGLNNRMTTAAQIRETTAIDSIAKGQAPSGDPTATQINTQMGQTNQRIESKARILEKDGIYWMAYIVFRLFQLYVDTPVVVNVKGGDTDDLTTTVTNSLGEEVPLPDGSALLDPADYQGKWRPKVTLEIDSNNKKLEEQQAAKETLAILLQDPTNNIAEIKKRVYPKAFDLSKEDLDAIITPDEAQMAQQQMMAGGMPPEGAPVDPMAQEQPALPPEAAEQPLPAEDAQIDPSQLPDDIDWNAVAQLILEGQGGDIGVAA